jgi:hypothetical protein
MGCTAGITSAVNAAMIPQSLQSYITIGPAVVIGVLAVVVFALAAMKLLPLMNGIVGGLVFLVIGLGLILGPTFYLIDTTTDKTTGMMVLSVFAIMVGCMSALAGAFSLMNFRDF